MASYVASKLFPKVYEKSNEFGVYDAVAYANYPGCLHPGTDFVAPAGTQTFALMAGTVSEVFARGNKATGRGNEVHIKFGNKELRYCHLSEINVTVGQTISVGDLVGLVVWTRYVVPQI